jgi:hypothetical protein
MNARSSRMRRIRSKSSATTKHASSIMSRYWIKRSMAGRWCPFRFTVRFGSLITSQWSKQGERVLVFHRLTLLPAKRWNWIVSRARLPGEKAPNAVVRLRFSGQSLVIQFVNVCCLTYIFIRGLCISEVTINSWISAHREMHHSLILNLIFFPNERCGRHF